MKGPERRNRDQVEHQANKPFHPELYGRYLRAFARIQLRRAGPLQNKVDASDVAQEALLQAVAALAQFKGSTDAEFAKWLRVILTSKLADAARHFGRKKRDAALEVSFRQCLDESTRAIDDLIPDDRTSPSAHVLREERVRRLAEVLNTLLPEQRMAIEYHHLSGHSVIETARSMERTPAAVAGLLRRGLKTLREGLEGREHELR